MPLSFAPVSLVSVLCSGDRLVKELSANYVADAILRSPVLLGSLDLLGNPTNLFSNFAAGFHDLFVLPTRAIPRGPLAFIGAFGSGVSSLLQHISEGTLQSVSGFTHSLARHVDALAPEHSTVLSTHSTVYGRPLEQRPEPNSLGAGVSAGVRSFGQGIVNGIAGVVTDPIVGATSSGPWGFVRGIGSGLTGIIARPLTGALDFVSQTSMGLASLSSVPRPVVRDTSNPLTSRSTT